MTGPAAGRRASGRAVTAWLRLAADRVHEQRAWLTELDAAIGDGDHGINLDRGFRAVAADLAAAGPAAGDAGTLLAGAGRRVLGLVGGASGALYGRGLMQAGARLPDTDDPLVLAEGALAAAIDGIVALGHAVPGDKTMLDALAPALDALRATTPGTPAATALEAAARAARAGRDATIPLVARKGRASYLGERSAGHLDPGAASAAILVECLAEALRPTIPHDPGPGTPR